MTPGSQPKSGDIGPILKALLPRRLTVQSVNGSGARGDLVVVDSRTGEKTFIRATRFAGEDVTWSETRPNGMKVGTRELPGEQSGVVEWRANALWTNGLHMSISAFNAPAPSSAKSAPRPAITLGELKAVATNSTWLAAR